MTSYPDKLTDLSRPLPTREGRARRGVRRPLAGPLAPCTRSGLRLAVAALLGSSPALAAPTGGVVTAGTATIGQNGTVTNVDQSSDKAIVQWQGFSVAPSETVNFNQPNAAAMTLNRIIGNERSVIEGALNANGQVFLVNSNGVLFARGSQVNVGGLVASTLDIADADFQAGNHVFKTQGGAGTVVNQGTIHTADGGYVALLSKQVSNDGAVVATKGTAALASGDQVTLTFSGGSLLGVKVDQGTLNALVENKQAVYADGGRIILTAKAADNLVSAQVNSSGILQARSLDDLTGSVTLHADGGKTTVSGTVDASAPAQGNGGAIETSGAEVAIADGATITTAAPGGKTGTWVLSADDLKIAATGGSVSGSALGAALGANNVSVKSTNGSAGDLEVGDALSWAGDTQLALTAAHDINVRAPVTASGANAGLSLTYGGDYHIVTPATFSGTVLDASGNPIANQAPAGTTFASLTLSGQNAKLSVNGQAYTVVHSMEQLAALGAASGKFALAQDLDATAWSAANPGAQSVITSLTGTLAGLGHTVNHLTLGKVGQTYVGLIRRGSSTTVRELGLLDANVQGTDSVGTLAGWLADASFITNCYATGKVSAAAGLAGGLVSGIGARGQAAGVSHSFTNVEVSGGSGAGLIGFTSGSAVNVDASDALGNVTSGSAASIQVGGLVGTTMGSVTNSYATGNVTAGGYVGGLVGQIKGSSSSQLAVSNSFATGRVQANASAPSSSAKSAGGLIGDAQYVDVSNSFALGEVRAGGSGFQNVGGLVGQLAVGNISHSHATGNVTLGQDGLYAGGLVGQLEGAISGSYASGNVDGSAGSGAGFVGGLAGLVATSGTAIASISSSSASGNATGVAQVGGLVGRFSGTTISDSHATGDVTAWNTSASKSGSMGGLAGDVEAGTIMNSSASGTVTGSNDTGGLVGKFWDASGTGAISNSWASGDVSGTGAGVGGLVGTGWFNLTINNSYWNVGSPSQNNPVGALLDAAGSMALFQSLAGVGKVVSTGSRGLTSTQLADVSHFVDGSIYDLLAQRAQAAVDAAKQASDAAVADAAAKVAAAQAAAEEATKAAAASTADAAVKVAAAQAAAKAASDAAAQASLTAQAQVAAAQAAEDAAKQAAADALAKGDADAAVKVAAAQAAADALKQAAAQATADAAAKVAAAQAAQAVATAAAQQMADQAQADAAARVAAAQAEIDAANRKAAEAAAQAAAAKAAAAQAAAEGAKQAADAQGAQAAAAKQAADAQTAQADAAKQIAAALAAQADAAQQIAAAQAAAQAAISAANRAATQAESDAAQQIAEAQALENQVNAQAASQAATQAAVQAAAKRTRQADAASATSQGALQLAEASRLDVSAHKRAKPDVSRLKPVSLGHNIVIANRGRFSTAIDRFVVDGKTFDLRDRKPQGDKEQKDEPPADSAGSPRK